MWRIAESVFSAKELSWRERKRVKSETGAVGYNAQTEKYEDLVKAGVIDPTKVVRAAIENASSIAGLLLTTEALVTEIPEQEKPASGGHDH